MALAPLKSLQPGVVTPAAAQRSPSVTQPAVFTSAAPQTQIDALQAEEYAVAFALPATSRDYVALVAAWMDEVEASAPPPSTLAFSIHMRRQAARLVELLGG